MPPYHAGTIAKWFVAWARTEDADLSNLKLQKLLYYAQGYHLALMHTVMFSDRIEAWSHGPVVPVVYRTFKNFGAGPIDDDSEFSWSDIDRDTTDLLIDIWNRYGGFDVWKLRNMTHSEAPWAASFTEDENHIEITPEALEEFFCARLVEG